MKKRLNEKMLRRLVQQRILLESADSRFEYGDEEIYDFKRFAANSNLPAIAGIMATAFEAAYKAVNVDVNAAFDLLQTKTIELASDSGQDSMISYIATTKTVTGLGRKITGVSKKIDTPQLEAPWNILPNSQLIQRYGQSGAQNFSAMVLSQLSSQKDGDMQEFIGAGLFAIANPRLAGQVHVTPAGTPGMDITIDVPGIKGIESKKSEKNTVNRLYSSSPPIFDPQKFYLFTTTGTTYVVRADILAAYENIARLPIGDLSKDYKSNINLVPDLLERQDAVRAFFDTDNIDDIINAIDKQAPTYNQEVAEYVIASLVSQNASYKKAGKFDELINEIQGRDPDLPDQQDQNQQKSFLSTYIRDAQIFLGTTNRVRGADGYIGFDDVGQQLRPLKQATARSTSDYTQSEGSANILPTFLTKVVETGDVDKPASTWKLPDYGDQQLSDRLNAYMFFLAGTVLEGGSNVSIPTSASRAPGNKPGIGIDDKLLSLEGFNVSKSQATKKELVSAAIAWNLANKSADIEEAMNKLTQFVLEIPNDLSLFESSQTPEPLAQTQAFEVALDRIENHTDVDVYLRRVIAMLYALFCPGSVAYHIFKRGQGGLLNFSKMSKSKMEDVAREFKVSVVSLSPQLSDLQAKFINKCESINNAYGETVWSSVSGDFDYTGMSDDATGTSDNPLSTVSQDLSIPFTLQEADLRKLVLELICRKYKID